MTGTRAYTEAMRRALISTAHSLPQPVTKVIYDTIVAAELAGVRMLPRLDNSDPIGHELIADTTAVVKTFERPRILKRLIASIRRWYPDLAVTVVDDSREPRHLAGVKTIVLPYQSGVSAGRQAALDQVTTTYFVLFDDDHVVYRHSALERALASMAQNPEIDILGGDEILLPLFSRSQYWHGDVYQSPPATRPRGSTIGGHVVCDRVPNFFLSRTARLRLVGWDATLTTVEHEDFFTRAKGVLTTVYDPDFRVLHARTPFDAHYMRGRLDFEHDLMVLRGRYGDAVSF